MRTRRVMVLAALLVAAAGACADDGGSSDDSGSGAGDVTLRLVAYDSFLLSDATLQQFTADTGIKVETVIGGDAGEVVNRAVLTKGEPEGDVLWGVDNTLLSRAVDEGIFVPYESPQLTNVDPAFTALVPGHEATPVDYGDVCVNYDKAWFEDEGIEPPTDLESLADPQYKDLLVVENPATSSPGLAFLLATIAHFGPEGWQGYWEDLRANGVEVVNGWTEAYSTQFSGSSGKGPKPLVVSYASSPPAEIVFATDPKPTEPPTGVVTDGCFRQVEFAGILEGTGHEEEARQLVDYMLSDTWQADIPLNMFVYPVRQGVALPEVFSLSSVPDAPLSVPPEEIGTNREAWIKAWTDTVLR
jgi:thiamine transport system substrate-binding protein